MADAQYPLGYRINWLQANLTLLVGTLPPPGEKMGWHECPLPHAAKCKLRADDLFVQDDDGNWHPTRELIDAAESLATSRGYDADDLFADLDRGE